MVVINDGKDRVNSFQCQKLLSVSLLSPFFHLVYVLLSNKY